MKAPVLAGGSPTSASRADFLEVELGGSATLWFVEPTVAATLRREVTA